MSYRCYLFLYLVSRVQDERTLSGIYHILRGRQSVQTTQDSFLFHVAPLFHALDRLERKTFQEMVEECMRKGWIAAAPEVRGRCRTTASGDAAMRRFELQHSFPEGLNEIRYVQEESSFWLRLQLVVQTLSAYMHGRRSFLPVTNRMNVTEDVRRFFMESSCDRRVLAQHVYTELHRLLSSVPESEADLLVAQFSGADHAGMTVEQLSVTFEMDPFQISLLFKSALRQMMSEIGSAPLSFPVLQRLFAHRRTALSRSAEKTMHCLQEGMSIQKVAANRNLSCGTIEDHIVEIALKVTDFSIIPYLPEETEQRVLQTAARLGTRELKTIRKALDGRESYFQIRLALAKAAMWRGEG